jgi:hypothetical protein
MDPKSSSAEMEFCSIGPRRRSLRWKFATAACAPAAACRCCSGYDVGHHFRWSSWKGSMCFFLFFFGQRPLVPLLLQGPPFFPIIHFGSTTLLTGMTGNSLHMQWPLTSQSHGSVSQREHLVFHYRSNSTPERGQCCKNGWAGKLIYPFHHSSIDSWCRRL